MSFIKVLKHTYTCTLDYADGTIPPVNLARNKSGRSNPVSVHGRSLSTRLAGMGLSSGVASTCSMRVQHWILSGNSILRSNLMAGMFESRIWTRFSTLQFRGMSLACNIPTMPRGSDVQNR